MKAISPSTSVRQIKEPDESPVRILITGFVSIEPELINASEILIHSIMTSLPASLEVAKHHFHFRLVDTNTHSLRPQLVALLDEVHPSECVFVGQAPGRNNITLESAATNLRFTGPPLHPGDAPQSELIHVGGPERYGATLPHGEKMVAELRACGIPAAISDNAGNNLCNQILYEGLRYSEQHAGTPKCGFVHIPALPQQIIERWPNYPFMPLDMLRQAMTIILLALMRYVRE